MSSADIQSIMQYGGPAALLVFLLVATVVALWKHYQTQAKIWTDSQIEDTRSMIEVTERSTNAIQNLTELLRSSAANNAAYQSEMRNKVDTALNELRQFRMEFISRNGNGGRRR